MAARSCRENKHLDKLGDQNTDTFNNVYHIFGWAIGVVLGLLVATTLVSGVAPDLRTIGLALPLLTGSALAFAGISG